MVSGTPGTHVLNVKVTNEFAVADGEERRVAGKTVNPEHAAVRVRASSTACFELS